MLVIFLYLNCKRAHQIILSNLYIAHILIFKLIINLNMSFEKCLTVYPLLLGMENRYIKMIVNFLKIFLVIKNC